MQALDRFEEEVVAETARNGQVVVEVKIEGERLICIMLRDHVCIWDAEGISKFVLFGIRY